MSSDIPKLTVTENPGRPGLCRSCLPFLIAAFLIFIIGPVSFPYLIANCTDSLRPVNSKSSEAIRYQGEVIRWQIQIDEGLSGPFSIRAPKVIPSGRSRLHLGQSTQSPDKIDLLFVPQTGGHFRLEGGKVICSDSSEIRIPDRTFEIKSWPDDPPKSSIHAGVGDLNVQWIFQEPEDQIRAGSTLTLDLNLEGDACLAIDSPPEILIQQDFENRSDRSQLTEPFQIRSVSSQSSFDPPKTTFSYEWVPHSVGRYRIMPKRFSHLKDGWIETKLLSGLHLNVLERPQLAVGPLPLKSQREFPQDVDLLANPVSFKWFALLLSIAISFLIIITYLWISGSLARVMIRWELRHGFQSFSQSEPSFSQRDSALRLYRRLEKRWFQYRDYWSEHDREQMLSITRLAFGNKKTGESSATR